MIHETLGGGFVGAVVIFGAVYAAIVAGGAVGCIVLAKAIPLLQGKKGAEAQSEEA